MADQPQRHSTLPYVVILVLGLILIGLLLYIIPFRYGLNASEDYTASDEPLNNPLIGFAPDARDEIECEDSQLVYIKLRWADWEPSMDEYDTDFLEETFHISQWKAAGKNAVLRFMCDIPRDEEHLDIPEWLYSLTSDGAYYDCSYGKGYCPDYSNDVFRERHALAIRALADYCNQDDFVAYVQLGSLGHWGEWHTNEEGGALPMPDADICEQYVRDYMNAFNNARLMTRRNYSFTVENGLGLYNDMTGDPASTQTWLDWIENGSSQRTEGDALELIPTGHFWDVAPVGGEFGSTRSDEEMLGHWLNDTMECVESTHMSFIGPHCPSGELKDSKAAIELRERLGYRLYVSHLETSYVFGKGELEVRMTWSNAGLAPLYWDWPVTMYVYDSSGSDEPIYWETVDIDLRELTPGEKIETVSHIPFTDVLRQGFQIGVGVDSPDLDQHILLAMYGEVRNGAKIIYTFDS